MTSTAIALDAARRLADAVEASVRVRTPVTGRQLVEAGVPPGPWVGGALRRTRDALIDEVIDEQSSLAFAVTAAQEAQEAGR